MAEETLALVYDAIGAVNAEREQDDAPIAAAPETPLIGAGSALDSLTFVTLVLEIEDRVRERTGISIELVNDRAMSSSRSPFRTVGSLAEYVAALVTEASG
jgi:D-alanine--poly(phosphoribitol) ligase subunit 2